MAALIFLAFILLSLGVHALNQHISLITNQKGE